MGSSQFSLRPVSATRLACKICGNGAPLYGVVDMHRPCQIGGVFAPALSGVPIYYRRCDNCGFLFTDAFDDWSQDDFKTHIYKGGYLAVDPGYVEVRPRGNAGVNSQIFGA